MRSWNKPVLSNEGKCSCSGKQREPLTGFELRTNRHTLFPRHTDIHIASQDYLKGYISIMPQHRHPCLVWMIPSTDQSIQQNKSSIHYK